MSNCPDIASHCTAVILAGGLGTRLRSVVSDRPKPLAEVNGRPFIAYLLDQLATTQIKQVILCTGYLGEKVPKLLGYEWQHLKLAYSQEKERLGTGGAIRLAMSSVTTKTLLVMNGDSFFDADLESFWQWHHQKSSMTSMLLTQVPDTKRFGRVTTDDNDVIIQFEEKGDTQGAGWINAGIYLFSKVRLQEIPELQQWSLEKDSFPKWTQKKLYGHKATGKFLDIGTPETYKVANHFFVKP